MESTYTNLGERITRKNSNWKDLDLLLCEKKMKRNIRHIPLLSISNESLNMKEENG